jgi:hypothetical protein
MIDFLDVRRVLNSEIKEFLEADRAARGFPRLPSGGGSAADVRDLDDRVTMMQQDVNAVRKMASERPLPAEVHRLIDERLEPLKSLYGQMDELEGGLSGIRGDMRSVSGQLDAARRRPPEQSRSDSSIPQPIPRQTPRDPIVVHDTPAPVIQLPAMPPPLEEGASIERQLRRLNELTGGFRLAIELLQENVQGNSDRIKTLVQQSNLRHVQLTADVDQVFGHVERLREKLAGIPPDFTKEIGEIQRDIDSIKGNMASHQPTSARRTVYGPGLHIAERLPPLPVPEPEPVAETFGLTSTDDLDTETNRSDKKSSQPETEDRKPPSSDSDDEQHLTPDNTGRGGSPKRDLKVRILKAPARTKVDPGAIMGAIPQISQSEIEEKVDSAIKSSITGFMERAKGEAVKAVEERLKVVDTISTQIDLKIDRDYCERMFNRFRLVTMELKNRIDDDRATFMGWVTREELELALEKLVGRLADIKDTAIATSKYNCLLCGKPRTHVSGMFIGEIAEVEEEFGPPQPKQTKTMRQGTRVSAPHVGRGMKRAVTPSGPRDIIQLLTMD